jgi:hypothetical protein
MANTKIDDQQMAKLREYELKTGVCVDDCIHEAIEDWLRHVAPFRIWALNSEAKGLPSADADPD